MSRGLFAINTNIGLYLLPSSFQVRDEVSRGLFAISVAAAVAGGEEGKDAATDQAAAFFLRLLIDHLDAIYECPDNVTEMFSLFSDLAGWKNLDAATLDLPSIAKTLAEKIRRHPVLEVAQSDNDLGKETTY